MTKIDYTHIFTIGGFALALVGVIAFATPSYAANGMGTDMKKHASSTMPHASSTLNLTCMQTAVDTRETAVGTAFDTLQASVKAQLATRKSSLHDAWGMTDNTARKTAIKSAWSKWKTDNRAVHTKLRTDRKNAWESFKTTVKNTCKVKLPLEETLSLDSVGQLSL